MAFHPPTILSILYIITLQTSQLPKFTYSAKLKPCLLPIMQQDYINLLCLSVAQLATEVR